MAGTEIPELGLEVSGGRDERGWVVGGVGGVTAGAIPNATLSPRE